MFEKVPGKMGEPDDVEQKLTGTQLKMNGWYSNDQLNGKVTYYKEDGAIDRIEVYENGTLVSTIEWDGKSDE